MGYTRRRVLERAEVVNNFSTGHAFPCMDNSVAPNGGVITATGQRADCRTSCQDATVRQHLVTEICENAQILRKVEHGVASSDVARVQERRA